MKKLTLNEAQISVLANRFNKRLAKRIASNLEAIDAVAFVSDSCMNSNFNRPKNFVINLLAVLDDPKGKAIYLKSFDDLPNQVRDIHKSFMALVKSVDAFQVASKLSLKVINATARKAESLKPVPEMPLVKKVPVKKVPVKKAVKKAPVKKAPVKKAPVKKAPVKKVPAKKKVLKRKTVTKLNTTTKENVFTTDLDSLKECLMGKWVSAFGVVTLSNGKTYEFEGKKVTRNGKKTTPSQFKACLFKATIVSIKAGDLDEKDCSVAVTV